MQRQKKKINFLLCFSFSRKTLRSILNILIFYAIGNTLFHCTPCSAADPSASLTLSNQNMISDTVDAGSTVEVSTEVTVDVKNAESYQLFISVDKPNLTNGNTTLVAGNVIDNNTWGYKWDNASTYTAPTTEGVELTVPALSANSASFTKTLTFGAKFSDTAAAGHYKASGTLSLIATPKVITKDLSSITYMQELDGHPEYCTNTPTLTGETYSEAYPLIDNRDYPKDANGNNVSNTYAVRKFGDDRCWMTENLRIYNTTIKAADSDFSGSDIELPNSALADFNGNDTSKYNYRSYYNTNTNPYTEAGVNTTTYYNWYTATAGAGDSSIKTTNQNVNTSICPKGWTLPTGGSNSSTSDFSKFITAESIGNSVAGSQKIRATPYNFTHTGRVNDGTLNYNISNFGGLWWSNMTSGTYDAYSLQVLAGYVLFGSSSNRYLGLAIRCIARNE